MFNLYQHMKDGREQKEPETTGHDRFYQERPRTSYRKKKRAGACRRARSAAELSPDSIAAANRRNAFKIRSVSTDREDSEEESSERAPLVAQKIDSLAKLLFNRSIIGGRASPSEPQTSPKIGERTMEVTAAVAICTEYLDATPRYELITALSAIGARPDKNWFAVHDKSIKTDRLLILMPLTSACPLEPGERSRALAMELFRALHHPYIYPVLDLDLRAGHAIVVQPYNAHGSLKDLLYKSTWSEDYARKYSGSGSGLPALQVARFGRQILEGLLFLKEKGFPPFRHLHSGNVMIQNGVARISGLENTLVGASSRFLMPDCEPEPLALGYLLYEMCACAELDLANLSGCLTPLLPAYTHVVEIIETIFAARTPGLHELVLCELFRKIDLREMKGSCLPNFSQRLSLSCVSLLAEVARRQLPPTPPPRRHHKPTTPPYEYTPHQNRRIPVRTHHHHEQDYTEDWLQW